MDSQYTMISNDLIFSTLFKDRGHLLKSDRFDRLSSDGRATHSTELAVCLRQWSSRGGKSYSPCAFDWLPWSAYSPCRFDWLLWAMVKWWCERRQTGGRCLTSILAQTVLSPCKKKLNENDKCVLEMKVDF